LDGAANMAGVTSRGARIKDLSEFTDEEWGFIMGVNLTGAFYAMRAQIKEMEAGGVVHVGTSIVNAGSIYGIEGKAKSSDYSATKHGVVGLSRIAAKEVGGKHIRVNCVAPGIINTPMVQNLSKPFLEGHERTLEQNQALHRMGDPTEIAKLNAFLLSEDSSFITGAVLTEDGGQVC
ncbi:hypothetical protein BCR34DRAFT_478639, partial [Clohesyomyces aquaticus]